jgi:hypothetical protein
MENRSTSIISQLLNRPRPLWVIVAISVFLLLLPFGFAQLDGGLDDVLQQGNWRNLILPPAVILYIWIISPFMARTAKEVIEDFRHLVVLDDESFWQLVNTASRINPIHELTVFIVGIVLGLISANFSGIGAGFSWIKFSWFLFTALMYGLLACTIYESIASTRLNAILHRQPLHIDIFTPEAFRAVGKLSLLLALVFIGGITLGFLLSFRWEAVISPIFWVVNLLLILVTLLIFFLSMYPTHQVLAREKTAELERVRRHIQQSCRILTQKVYENQETGSLASTIHALSIYEQRILSARTWPYNTSMLRTLFFTVLIPIGTALARLAGEILYPR